MFTLIGFGLIGLSFTNLNPLNSVVMSTTRFKEYTLTDHYITLKNNINNKNSAAYIADKPALAAIEQAALSLPSDSFTVAKDDKVVLTLKLINVPQRAYVISNPATGEQKTIASALTGDMTAVRAIEIINNNYDRGQSSLVNGYLTFNHKKFNTIEHTAIQNEVIALAWAELK
jgi:hypothetical protein